MPKGTFTRSVMGLPTFDRDTLGPNGFDLTSHLHSSDLATHLSSWFGPADERVPGKYRTAEVFYFDGGLDGIVMANCERGDRGSNWFWIPHTTPPGGHSPFLMPLSLSIPTAPPAWPHMLIDLSHRFALVDPSLNAKQFEESMLRALNSAPVPKSSNPAQLVSSSPKKRSNKP